MKYNKSTIVYDNFDLQLTSCERAFTMLILSLTLNIAVRFGGIHLILI